MNITQTFYNSLASEYDKLFYDWRSATQEQALMLKLIFDKYGFDNSADILDCACGIGTQAIGLACLGYKVTASDISNNEIDEAKKRVENFDVNVCFKSADFRYLNEVFNEQFDIVIAMDNALPHMISDNDLEIAVKSIVNQIKPGGIFVGSIRDYDALLKDKPPYSPPYIHKTKSGQRVSFQTWEWNGDCYKLIQYIIDDDNKLNVSRYECEYRAVRREELTTLFMSAGCKKVDWLFSDETNFYQPIIVAVK